MNPSSPLVFLKEALAGAFRAMISGAD